MRWWQSMGSAMGYAPLAGGANGAGRIAAAGAFVALIALAGGCHVTVPSLCRDLDCGCFSLDDCGPDSVCFLGTCQSPGYNISEVYIDLLPPNDSGLPPQRDIEYPRSFEDGLRFDISLRGAVQLRGTLVGNPVPGVLAAHPVVDSSQVVVPSMLVLPTVDVAGAEPFVLDLLAGRYDVTFTPDAAAAGAVAGGLPPVTVRYDVSRDLDVQFSYPHGHLLVRLRGALRNRFTQISGARVQATARGIGDRVLRSTSTETDGAGAFAIALPPGADQIDVMVGPGSNVLVPHVVFSDVGLDRDGQLEDLILHLPQEPFALRGRVQEHADASRVAGAVAYFDGVLALPDSGRRKSATFAIKATTDEAGEFDVQLWPGTYSVTIAPPPSDGASLGSFTLCVPRADGDNEQSDGASCPGVVAAAVGRTLFELPAKVRFSGQVRSHDTSALAAARVALSRRDGPIAREFVTTTDHMGKYQVAVDAPPAGAVATYDLTVEPDPALGLPLFRELLRVEGNDAVTRQISLYPPSFAFGRVRSPGGQPLAGVILTLYSTELATDSSPLLVGIGRTSDAGEFVIPLPSLGGQ